LATTHVQGTAHRPQVDLQPRSSHPLNAWARTASLCLPHRVPANCLAFNCVVNCFLGLLHSLTSLCLVAVGSFAFAISDSTLHDNESMEIRLFRKVEYCITDFISIE
jgi:hypothetical protein